MRLALIAACICAFVTPLAAQKKAPPKYDTPAESTAKINALYWWVSTQDDINRHDTPEYLDKVKAIVEKIVPHEITSATYQGLRVHDTNGAWMGDVWLTLGSLRFKELRHTSAGNIETTVLQWTNPNGSTLTATFRNHRLLEKSQAGLR